MNIENLAKQATQLYLRGNYESAGDCYAELAKVFSRMQHGMQAGFFFDASASAYTLVSNLSTSKTDEAAMFCRAKNAHNMAITTYASIHNYAMAAKQAVIAASMCLTNRNYEEASTYYISAANFYSAANLSLQSNQCMYHAQSMKDMANNVSQIE